MDEFEEGLEPRNPNRVGPRHVIDVMGLGPEVLRLKRLRLHTYEIANQLNQVHEGLNISHDAVNNWITHYEALPPEEQAKIESTTIYNLAQRVQDLAVDVSTITNRPSTDDQAKLKGHKVTRKILQLVAKVTEDLENMKRDEQVRSGMMDIMDRIHPGARRTIEQRLLEGDYTGAPDPLDAKKLQGPTIDAESGQVVPTQPSGPTSTIDAMGLGPDILRSIRAGRTQQETADLLGLTREQVNRWLARYKKMSPDEQIMLEERSIFNVVDRLEENFQGLFRVLQSATEDTFILDIYNEMLENLKFAQGTVGRLQRMRADERFEKIFLGVLLDLPQGDRATAINALNGYRRDQASVRVSG